MQLNSGPRAGNQGAHLVKEDSSVCLEGLPLQAGPEDNQRSHRAVHVETQILCRANTNLTQYSSFERAD